MHGTRFNTDVSFSLEAKASFSGIGVDLARFELSGDGFTLGVGGQDRFYSVSELALFEADLINIGLDATAAEALTDALGSSMAAADAIADAVDELVPDTDPFFSQAPPEDVPIAWNHDGGPIEWIELTAGTQLNLEGDLLGGEVDNVFYYAQGNGSITIYDNSNGTASADRLVFEYITAEDATFSQNDDFDLIITLENGDTVTVNNYFYNPTGENAKRSRPSRFIAGLATSMGTFIRLRTSMALPGSMLRLPQWS